MGRLRVFEIRVLRRIFGPKREEVAEDWRRLIMRNFITCTLHQILLGDQMKEDEVFGTCSTYGSDENCILYFGWKT